jgi:hypothetical protein
MQGANGKHKFLGGMLEYVVQSYSYFAHVEESVQARLSEEALSEQVPRNTPLTRLLHASYTPVEAHLSEEALSEQVPRNTPLTRL